MANKSVFLLDDEFPKIPEFIKDAKYSKAIEADDLYHLALNEDWKNLSYLQQLIKDIRTSDEFASGDILLSGYSHPEIALQNIDEGVLPNIVVYDWQYETQINHQNSKTWLLEILEKTSAFVFIYSYIEPQLSIILNDSAFNSYRNRFQLFLKGGNIPQSFSSEEFIYQYIVNSVSNQVSISINGIKIDFKSNNYLANASDILYLQRILGSKYFLDELTKIDFEVNEAGIEKILNDSDKYIYYDSLRKILINPKELGDNAVIENYSKITFADVIKDFSIEILEDTLDRGFYVLKN